MTNYQEASVRVTNTQLKQRKKQTKTTTTTTKRQDQY